MIINWPSCVAVFCVPGSTSCAFGKITILTGEGVVGEGFPNDACLIFKMVMLPVVIFAITTFILKLSNETCQIQEMVHVRSETFFPLSLFQL